MIIETIAIDAIHADPDNVRIHSDRNLDAIKASLRRFGQQKPIVVDENLNIVRTGNGTLEAARALDWPTIEITRTTLKDFEAIAYAIADNRAAELAEWDGLALGIDPPIAPIGRLRPRRHGIHGVRGRRLS